MYLTGACRSSSRGKFKLSDTRKIILAKYRPRPLRGLRSTNTRVSHRYDVSPTVAKVSHTHTHTRNAAAERTSVAAMAIGGCRSGGVGFSVWGARATTTIGNWTVQLVRAAQSASRCPDPKISYRRQHLYSHIPSVGRPEDHSSSSSGPLVDLFWPVGQRRGHLPHLHNQKPEPSMAAHKLLAAGPLPCDSRSHSHCDLSILAAFTCRRT